MRIIQVINVRWFNATAWYGLELARLAKNAGHECLVMGLKGTEPMQRATDLNLDTACLCLNTKSPLAWPFLLYQMYKIIRTFKPDIINCHRGEAFIFFAALNGLGYKLVRTRGDQRSPRANLINKYLHARIADAVIATNSSTAKELADKLKVPPEKLHTIFGGVDIEQFSPNKYARKRTRYQLDYRESDIVVGLLGRFDTVKGQKEAIMATARLVREGLPVRLLLIGFATATSEEEVRTWISESGMDHRVDISGRIEDVGAWINAIDIGLVASLRSEAIARAALEIMACGKPLISTRVGVMPDILPEEALCASGDIDALTDILRHAIKDKAFRERLTKINRKRLPELESTNFLRETLKVYEGVLAKQQVQP